MCCCWSELPLDVLCTVAGHLPSHERIASDGPAVSISGVLRLVCRDWRALLDTSITQLKFMEDWPELGRVVAHFPFLHSADLSACTLSWTQEGGAAAAVPASASGPNPVQALLRALQPLCTLRGLQVLKLGYGAVRLLQVNGNVLGESEQEWAMRFGAVKESPPYSPASRLLSRLQASSRGNLMGTMDQMDGLELSLASTPLAAQPSPHMCTVSSQLSPLPRPESDTMLNDQDGVHPRRHGNITAGGTISGGATNSPGSRLKVMTAYESPSARGGTRGSEKHGLPASSAMLSSPARTPKGRYQPRPTPLDQFICLLEQLSSLQELHVVIRETDNLAVYKITPAASQNTAAASTLAASRMLMDTCATSICHGSEAATAIMESYTPGMTAAAAPATPMSGHTHGGLTTSSGHPFNAAFFSSPTPSPSTPTRLHITDPCLSSSPAPSVPQPNPIPTGRDSRPRSTGPQPTPPPSTPTTPMISFTSNLRSSPHTLLSPLPSPSSLAQPPEGGPWVQLGRKLQLPSSFGQLHLSFIFLRSQNLQILPGSVGMLTSLQELCLPANGLANLPHTMSRLQQLKALDVSDNRLRSSGLLLALSSLTTLQNLNLHRNRLLDTAFLTHLTQLHYLDLGSNKLKVLTNLSNMKFLHTLDLSNNHLSLLPVEISTLEALDFLDVRRNRLSTLPASLGCLTGLTYLNASHNYIRSVAGSMLARLGLLQTLNLADNCLREMPDTIGACSHLGHLNMSCNQLDALPVSMSSLTQLSSLVLNSNEVEELLLDNLPLLCNVEACDNYLMRVTLQRLPSLEHLKLSGNYLPLLHLDSFPRLRYLHVSANHLEQVELSSLPCLIFLDLSHNLLTEVPLGVRNLTALQLLFLSANRLACMPSMLSSLKQLTALHLDKNKLQEVCWTGAPALLDMDVSKNRLQQVCVKDCPLLHTLSLARNELDADGIQLSGLPDMQILDLGKNKLIQLPACITNLPALRRLDLSHNQLPQLPDFLTKLSCLAELMLKDNLLLELPDVLSSLDALTFLDVASNPIVSISPLLNKLTNLKQIYMRHISAHTLWVPEPPSPLALPLEPLSPSSQVPASSTVSTAAPNDSLPLDQLHQRDMGDDASSQLALPLPPLEGMEGRTGLPADITQTVLEDITLLNASASFTGLPAEVVKECGNIASVSGAAGGAMLGRSLAVGESAPHGREGITVAGLNGAGSESGGVSAHAAPAHARDTSSKYDNMSHGDKCNIVGRQQRAEPDSVPPIRPGSGFTSSIVSQLVASCITSVSELSHSQLTAQAGAGELSMREAPNGSPSTCRSCGGCPDCLGRMLATAISWPACPENYVACGLRAGSSGSALHLSPSLPSSGCIPSQVGSHCSRSHILPCEHARSPSPSCLMASSDLTSTISSMHSRNDSDSSTQSWAPLLCAPSPHPPSPRCCSHVAPSTNSDPARSVSPSHAVHSTCAAPPSCSRTGSGLLLPTLVPASSPPPGLLPCGHDMREWGESSVWLLLMQLFGLYDGDMHMPLPHALVRLEISNPACKVKVDRDVGLLIARVLAKLTRSAAQFMRSLERHSGAAATKPGGSCLHSPEFGARLKSGYGTLLRLVRRHYGLRLEALDLHTE